MGELRKKLGQMKRLWAEEFSSILWGYHWTPQSSTKETPYRLTYGSDAMIPVELREASWRRTNFDEQSNDDNLRAELNLVHEIREEARVREEVAKLRVARRYNTRVHKLTFQKGIWGGERLEKPAKINRKVNWHETGMNLSE